MELYRISIGDLARRTGLGVSTIRAWEARYGFPVPERLPGGHRRYSEQDVQSLLAVARERRLGASLPAAIERARRGVAVGRSSVLATLRQFLPGLAPAVLSKRALLALTRAVEDEVCSRAEGAVLLGGFQHVRFLHASAARWRDLARTAQISAVLAAGASPSRHDRPLARVRLGTGDPLTREWFVICDAARFAVALAGFELPGDGATRRFEVLWTTDPIAVREAARSAASVAAARLPRLRHLLLPRLEGAPRASYDPGRAATAVANRFAVYLDPG